MCQSSAADWLVGLIELVGSAGLVELVGSAGLVQHCALSGKACYACFCFPPPIAVLDYFQVKPPHVGYAGERLPAAARFLN